MLHDWTAAIDKNNISHIEFLCANMRKAKASKLLKKIASRNFSDTIISARGSYLTNRTRVSVNSISPDPIKPSIGSDTRITPWTTVVTAVAADAVY